MDPERPNPAPGASLWRDLCLAELGHATLSWRVFRSRQRRPIQYWDEVVGWVGGSIHLQQFHRAFWSLRICRGPAHPRRRDPMELRLRRIWHWVSKVTGSWTSGQCPGSLADLSARSSLVPPPHTSAVTL